MAPHYITLLPFPLYRYLYSHRRATNCYLTLSARHVRLHREVLHSGEGDRPVVHHFFRGTYGFIVARATGPSLIFGYVMLGREVFYFARTRKHTQTHKTTG